MPDPILSLPAMQPIRFARDITAKGMDIIVGFPTRLFETCAKGKAHEPTLPQACTIARALRYADILPLMGVDNIHDVVTGTDLHDDLDVWMSGLTLPLRFAIRLARHFGLADPARLMEISPVDQEIWSIVASGERTPGMSTCPWCSATVGDGGHKRTCLPGMLYHPRNLGISVIGQKPHTRKPNTRQQGNSAPARSLKVIRKARGVKQIAAARLLDVHPSYFARLEQLRDPLRHELAVTLGTIWKLPSGLFYEPPGQLPGSVKLSGTLT